MEVDMEVLQVSDQSDTPTKPSEIPWQNGYKRVKTGSVEHDAFVAMGYVTVEHDDQTTILVKDRRHVVSSRWARRVPSRWARRSEDKTRIKARTVAYNDYLAACEEAIACPGLDFPSFCVVLEKYDRAKGER